jgi:hypothetical protein
MRLRVECTLFCNLQSDNDTQEPDLTPVTPADMLKNAPHCKNLPGSNFLNNDEAFTTLLTTLI